MAKKFVFFIILFLALLLFSEAVFHAVYRAQYDYPVVQAYKATMESAKKYYFDKRIKMIMPVPGETIVDIQQEFTDRFKINDVNGFGMFDDGIQKRKVKALALGDSFTRGVGSGDNLTHGWVELLENKFPELDICNLGFSGTSQIGQIEYYNRIAEYIEHEIVLLSFFSGGDFNENLEYFNLNERIKRLVREIDRDKYIYELLRSINYDLATEYLAYSPIKSYTAWFFLKVYKRCVSRFPPFSPLKQIYVDYRRGIKESRDLLPQDLMTLSNVVFIKEISADNRFIFNYDQRLFRKDYQSTADKIARHSAKIVNDFNGLLSQKGKKLIIIIHPSREEIYLRRLKTEDYDFDFTRENFKKYLAGAPVLDLTDKMRLKAQELNEPLYYRIDGHYRPIGYRIAFEIISEYLKDNVINKKYLSGFNRKRGL